MRLIDANAYKTSIMRWKMDCIGHDDYESASVIDDCACELDSMPTVDAVPVVHGEWERIEDNLFDLVTLKCSVCGEEWCFEDYDDCIPQNYHYCPNCGARMDLED
jgi:hypothetical protein